MFGGEFQIQTGEIVLELRYLPRSYDRDYGHRLVAQPGDHGGFRASLERGSDFELVAFNDLGDLKTMAHLFKHDSVLGRFHGDVSIGDGDTKPIRIDITMNNSSGIYQIDSLLRAKLRGSGLEPYVEVFAHIDTEAEKSLVPVYRLEV